MPRLDSAALLEMMLRDSGGVEVVYQGQSTWGHYGERDVVYETGTTGTERTVLVATGRLTGLREKVAITVDGTAYTISQHRRIEDGGLTNVHLRV